MGRLKLDEAFWRQTVGDERYDAMWKVVVLKEGRTWGVTFMTNLYCVLSGPLRTKREAVAWAKKRGFIIVPIAQAKAWEKKHG